MPAIDVYNLDINKADFLQQMKTRNRSSGWGKINRSLACLCSGGLIFKNRQFRQPVF